MKQDSFSLSLSLYQKILFVFPMLFLSACGGGNSGDKASSSTPNDAVSTQISINSLDKETLTLTNTGKAEISSLGSPEISTALKSLLNVNSSSTCDTAIPLASGRQCTYQFVIQSDTTVPGVTTGTIVLPVTFADNTTKSITMQANVTNYLYAANAAGVYQWDGSSWNTIAGSPEQVTTLLLATNKDTADGEMLYTGSNTGTSGRDIYKWNGATWTALAGTSAPNNIYALALTTVNSQTQLFAGSNNDTAGAAEDVNDFSNNAWSSIGSGLNQVDSLIESNLTQGTLYAGSMTGTSGADVNVYNGSTWSALGTDGPSNVAAMVFDNNILYTASMGNNSSSGEDVNMYNGSTWSVLGGAQTPNAVQTITLNNGKVYAGSDANYVWSSHANKRAWYAISASSTGQYLAGVVYKGYIYTSSDYGKTWAEEASSGEHYWAAITASDSGKYLAAGTLAGYIYTSTDYGVTWTKQTKSGQHNWVSITSSANGQHLAAVDDGPGYIYTSSDYGNTWTERTDAGQQYWASITSSVNGQYLAATSPEDYIYTSNDYGVTWTKQTQSPQLAWISLASSASGQYLVAAPSEGYVYRSSDYGVTWVALTQSGIHNRVNIVSSASGQYLATTSYSGYIYVSANDGTTWSPQTNAGVKNWFGLAMAKDGTHLISPAGTLYIGTGPFNINVYNNGKWSALVDLNSSVDALATDSDGNLYGGGKGSTNTVFQFKNSALSSLSGNNAPANITALALGSALKITQPIQSNF